MEYSKCLKCGKETWVEIHHILPKATFGETEHKAKLCPNCHNEYHLYMSGEAAKIKDRHAHLRFFYNWLLGFKIIGSAVVILALWWLWP